MVEMDFEAKAYIAAGVIGIILITLVFPFRSIEELARDKLIALLGYWEFYGFMAIALLAVVLYLYRK